MTREKNTAPKNTETLGPLLRKAREDAGMSLKDAAGRIGITDATLSRIETSKINVNADRTAQMAALYGLSLAELVEGHLTPVPQSQDTDRLHAIIMLVHTIATEQGANPSPEKLADVIVSSYVEVIEKGIGKDHITEHLTEKLVMIFKA